MKLLRLIICAFFVVSAISSADAAADDAGDVDILDLEEDDEHSTTSALNISSFTDWQREVMNSGSAFIIGFSDSERVSGSEEQLVQMLGEVGSKLEPAYGVRMAHVDCALKSNKKVCNGIQLKTIPAFGFVTAAPEINPYSKKLHRPVSLYDGPPADLKSLERRFAKNYPGADTVEVLSSAKDLADKGDAAIVVSMTKSSLSLFSKSVCYAFRTHKCVQLTKPEAEDVSSAFSIPEGEVPSGNWAGYLSQDGTFHFYRGAQPVTDDRTGLLAFLAPHVGAQPEAVPEASAAKSGSGSEGSNTQDADVNGVPVDRIDAAAFDGELDTGYAWLVGVHASDKASDKEEHAVWKKTVGSCEGVIRPVQLLCQPDSATTSSFGDELCGRRGLPFIAVIPRYGPDAAARLQPNKLQVFDASDASAAKKAAQSTLSDEAILMIGEAEIEFVMQKAVEEKKVAVMVLSDKETPPAVLNNLALTLKDYALISFISEPTADFLARLGGIQKLPSVLCAVPSSEPDAPPGQHSIMQYDTAVFGPFKYMGLQNFILSSYQRSGLMEQRQKESSEQPEPTADLSGKLQTEMHSLLTEADWQNYCSTTYRGMCVLGLTRHGEAESAQDAAVLESTMRHMGRQGAAFTFMTTDGACQTSFSSRFDVDIATLPRVVTYAPAKGRFMTMSGDLSEVSLVGFLKEALSGKVSSQAIPQRPEMSSECEYQDFGDIEESVDEGDMDDFLEEIRREEAAAKLALKKELEAEKKAADAAAKEAEEAAKKPKKTIRKVKKKSSKKKKAKTEL